MAQTPRRQLGRKSVLSVLWGVGGIFLNNIVGLASFIILARLLSPADYGLMSASMVLVNFAGLISDAFIGPSIIQRQNVDRRYYHAAYTAALIVGVFLMVAIALASPLVASFYRMPEVRLMALAISPLLLLRALTTVPQAIMQRNLRYRARTVIAVVAAVADAVVSVCIALAGYGAWALVGAVYTNVIVSGVMTTWLERRSLGLNLDMHHIRDQLFGLGGGFVLTRVSNFVARNVDNVVVGRTLGGPALGLYSRSYSLMNLGVTALAGVATQTLFPVLASVQSDTERLRVGMRRSVAMMALLSLPVSVVGVVAGDALIRAALGERWIGAILPFQVLMAVFFARTGYKATETTSQAQGRVYGTAWRQAIYALMVFGGAAIGSQWGITGVAVLTSVAIVVFYAMSADFARRSVGMPWLEFLAAHRPGLLLALAGGVPAWLALLAAPTLPALGQLALQCVAAGLGMLLAIKLRPSLFLGEAGLWLTGTLAEAAPFARPLVGWLVGPTPAVPNA